MTLSEKIVFHGYNDAYLVIEVHICKLNVCVSDSAEVSEVKLRLICWLCCVPLGERTYNITAYSCQTLMHIQEYF